MPGKEETKESAQDPNGAPDWSDRTDKSASGFPDWLNEKFVAEALGVAPGGVSGMQVRPAVPAGSNYCSCLWRVRVRVNPGVQEDHADHGDHSLIVKEMPKGDYLSGMITSLGFFARELKMLQETLPALEALGVRRGLGARGRRPGRGRGRPLCAEALPCSRPDTVVMRDLAAQGFRMADRQSQLDLPHCKVALETLATLHALSAAMHREDPASMLPYHDTSFQGENTLMEKRLVSRITNFADEIESWEELGGADVARRYAGKLRALAPSARARMARILAPLAGEGDLNVLNHGDSWVNNYMFRYDGDPEHPDVPVDMRFVDFQLSVFASPAVDLRYLITTSVRAEIREQPEQLAALLEHYRGALNDRLEALGRGGQPLYLYLSREQLQRYWADTAFLGLHLSFAILPVVVADPDPQDREQEVLRLDDVTWETALSQDPLRAAWRGRAFRKLLPPMFQHFQETGLL